MAPNHLPKGSPLSDGWHQTGETHLGSSKRQDMPAPSSSAHRSTDSSASQLDRMVCACPHRTQFPLVSEMLKHRATVGQYVPRPKLLAWIIRGEPVY